MASIDADDVFYSNTSTNPTSGSGSGGRRNSSGNLEQAPAVPSRPRAMTEADLDNFVGRPRSRSLYATARPLVYITRRVPQRGVDVLLPVCNVGQWDSEEAVPRGELLQNVRGVRGILCMPSDIIDRQVLEAAGSNLRAVATLSQDTRHIDVDECSRRDIQVLCCPLPDLEGQTDLTVALILLTLRSVAHDLHMDNRQHNTNCDLFPMTQGKKVDVTSAWWQSLVQHKTFAVYGLTPLGVAVARRLRQLGANDIIMGEFDLTTDYEPPSPEVSEALKAENFEVVPRAEFLTQSDIVVLCSARATNQNDAAFDSDAFHALKSSVILVNSDSGHPLNYAALYEALRDGQICAAGLNTCNQTPVPYQYPLQGLKNCVFMPQTQEDRTDLRHRVTIGLTTNLLRALRESVL